MSFDFEKQEIVCYQTGPNDYRLLYYKSHGQINISPRRDVAL